MKSDKQLIRESDEKLINAGRNGNCNNLGSVGILTSGGFEFNSGFSAAWYWQEYCLITKNRLGKPRKVIRGVFTMKDAERIAEGEWLEFRKNNILS